MARGKVEVSFGPAPGTATASVVVSGLASIEARDIVNAFVIVRATTTEGAAHTADEHAVDAPRVFAGEPTAGSGFTIYAVGQGGALVYGDWSIGWSY
jgi:hypothetical protein